MNADEQGNDFWHNRVYYHTSPAFQIFNSNKFLQWNQVTVIFLDMSLHLALYIKKKKDRIFQVSLKYR